MRVAAAIISWNGEALIGPCLESLVAQSDCPDILVLDNASTDGTVEIAESYRARVASRQRRLKVVVEGQNFGFTVGANHALEHLLGDEATYDVVALVNQDVTLDSGWVASIERAFERNPNAGVIGGKTFYPDGKTLQHAGGDLTRPRLVGLHYGQREVDDKRYDEERDVEFVTGALIAFRASCLRAVGLFDEIFSPGYYEDVDLCAPIRNGGWRVVYAPSAKANHVESASFTDRFARIRLSHRNRIIFALGQLTDPAFASEFRAAERAAFATEPFDVLRAMGQAYVQVAIRLDELVRARLPQDRQKRAVVTELANIIAGLRASLLEELHRRRASSGELSV